MSKSAMIVVQSGSTACVACTVKCVSCSKSFRPILSLGRAGRLPSFRKNIEKNRSVGDHLRFAAAVEKG